MKEQRGKGRGEAEADEKQEVKRTNGKEQCEEQILWRRRGKDSKGTMERLREREEKRVKE